MVPGGNGKPTLVDAERDTGGGEDADGVVSDKIRDASIDEERSIIDEGGDSSGSGAPTGMVLDPDGESILNSEKGRLKADGVQEGSESVPLFAPKGSSPGPLSQRPEPLNMELSAQMVPRDWNPAWWRLRTRASAQRGAGSDSPAAGGGRGAELDPVIPTLFPKDSPVSGVVMKHRGVTPPRKRG